MIKQEVAKLLREYAASGKSKYMLIVRDINPGDIKMQCPDDEGKPRKFNTDSNFDFPAVVSRDDVRSISDWIKHYTGGGLKVIEVYDLDQDLDKQLAEPQCWSV